MVLFFKQKPFWKLKSREEVFNYFKKSKNWKKLDDEIINTIIDKFIDDMKAFEVFVYISENCNLARKNFVPLAKKGFRGNISFTMLTFATTLYNTGSIYRDKLIEILDDSSTAEKEKLKLLDHAKMAYESAIKLDKYFVSVYYQLGVLWGVIQNEYDEGIKYCQKGIEIINEIEAMPTNKLSSSHKQIIEQEKMKHHLHSLMHELNKKKEP